MERVTLQNLNNMKKKDGMSERLKATAILKAALEFNSNVIMIATTALVDNKNPDTSKLNRDLVSNFEDYRKTLEMIVKK